MTDLKEILSNFPVSTEISLYGNGHINDTYITNGSPSYILQKMNTKIFKDTERLMQNVVAVTSHVREKIIKDGGDPERESLTVIPTNDGKNYYASPDGDAYRLYIFIKDAVTYDVPENPKQMYEVGKAFGKFQKQLADFNIDVLYETIPNFHNTPKRVENLEAAIKKDAFGRANEVKKEIAFARKYSKYADLIQNGISDGSIPLRVTHNDTKINNVMLDLKTGKAVCVIDLDTVMPGSLLYDYGDALRTGAATAPEDEHDLSKMYLNMDCFYEFSKGFLSYTKDTLTKKEIELLPLSVLILTYECGIRFLEDYLNGDTYFKTHYNKQNLYRTRTQFKLVKDIESKLPDMQKIIDKILEGLK
ncbi:MAG: aminoglycoside phosphotransferase family protein [Clostridia bacterium]|nr:aminoglycoside phosphotransferase family protein [Clostridia bacterium]